MDAAVLPLCHIQGYTKTDWNQRGFRYSHVLITVSYLIVTDHNMSQGKATYQPPIVHTPISVPEPSFPLPGEQLLCRRKPVIYVCGAKCRTW